MHCSPKEKQEERKKQENTDVGVSEQGKQFENLCHNQMIKHANRKVFAGHSLPLVVPPLREMAATR